jgi:hypothetical protein
MWRILQPSGAARIGPQERGDGDPLVIVSLAFTVSVRLADVEFSIAC